MVLCHHILFSVVTKICLCFCNIFCYQSELCPKQLISVCNFHLNYKGVYPGQGCFMFRVLSFLSGPLLPFNWTIEMVFMLALL